MGVKAGCPSILFFTFLKTNQIFYKPTKLPLSYLNSTWKGVCILTFLKCTTDPGRVKLLSAIYTAVRFILSCSISF